MKDLAKAKYVNIEERRANSIKTGFGDIDKHIKGLRQEEITIVFGRNGEGKSTIVSQMIAHHINANGKAYLYSGELGETKLQEWLYKQIVGGDDRHYREVKTEYGNERELKPYVIDKVKRWHKGRLFIYDMKLDKIRKDTKRLFEDMLEAKKNGITLFVIDNLMTAYEINERTQYADQANFVQACKDFARDNTVHVVLIAHPNKAKDELDYHSEKGNLAKNDVSGSGNISNKADNVIAVERIWKELGVIYDDSIPDAFVSVLKEREGGGRATYKYWFSHKSLRFYNNNTDLNVNYDWENKGKQTAFVPANEDDPF